ncbi:vWA domain-containing protein [Roseobacter weihaiensis]|uniref:vWA domain-containing protein n=1 Tax=Roseobacter weihaiensis TaxID=2763262 RepID=UPI001D0A275E|nr:vWA domain-containing protein [Roseobacter sp. H9]
MILRAFSLLVAAVAFWGSSLAAQPLLVEGTQTVFQRVLTRPAATLHGAADGPVVDQIPAFQPFYVFADTGAWKQIGPSVSRDPTGWVKTEDVVEWKQNIVGAFTNGAGRERQLMFSSEEDLRWLLNHEALPQIQERLLAEATAGISQGDRGVVSVEPEEYVNIREDLYVMPILDFVEDLHPLNYEDILLMEVASVPLQTQNKVQDTTGQDTAAFDVGIVFVLDTTQSMETYIARTQKVLKNTVERIAGTEIGKLVNFGAIGFRDNTDAVPALEYRTRVLADIKRRDDQSEVIAAIGNARVATANSPGFNEDSLAGVEDAIDRIDWQQEGAGDPIDARYIILVTDAGPKDPRDPNARSPIGVQELQADAEGKNIVTMTLHLKTPTGGEANHAYAESQYRALSTFAGRQYYFPIEGGSEEAFEGVATRLVTAITDHVRIARGEDTFLSADEAGEDLVALGRAMRLAYLGTQRGTQAPDVIRGWISDKAVEAPQSLAVEPRLLITKNEMATMAELLDNLIRLGEQSQGGDDALNFFTQVRGVIADMATNPDRRLNTEAETLGGALEYLEQLPYRSQLLQMTEDRWAQSAMLRRSIIDGMRQKLTQYRKWLFDPQVWTALHEGATDGELVFAMPFDVLP